MRTILSCFVILFATLNYTTQPVDLAFHINSSTEDLQEITLTFKLEEQELLLKHSLDFSIDSPYIELQEIKESKDPVEKYDPVRKETQLVFDKEVSFVILAKTIKDNLINALLHVTYQTNKEPYPINKLFPITFSNAEVQSNNDSKVPPHTTSKSFSTIKHKNESLTSVLYSMVQSWNNNLSTLIEKTKSLPIRLIFVFLLGILLSLTPCIYPMIPITVGILQTEKSDSIIHNFGRSFAYTLGLSTTFACFGLAASISGPIYGKLLMSPISVSLLVMLLGFLGLSMFGLYDIQLPKFLQLKKESNGNGSFISSFIFGAASGTIASPCVSPGLILLLSLVATLGNLLLGFLFLFTFGLGLSIPLLLIGTFSSSINMLPRAGIWMVEIKKLFGIMLFAVCFFYLNNIINQTVLMYLISLSLFTLGMYYFLSGIKTSSPIIKKFSNGFGFLLLCSSVISLGYTLKNHYLPIPTNDKQNFWLTDYQQGRKKGLEQNKLLFIDFWAEYCSICKVIDKKINRYADLQTILKNMVLIKINGTYNKEPFTSLKKQFKIVGFPTFLVVDPKTESIIKEWHSELYHMPKKEFIKELENIATL